MGVHRGNPGRGASGRRVRGWGGSVLSVLVVLGAVLWTPVAWAGTSPGQVLSFGSNFEGELGNTSNLGTNSANPTPTPVTLPGATGPVKLMAVGSYYSLAVTSTGQLFAWGQNDRGQLGYSTNAGTSNPNPTPAEVSLPGASGPPSVVAAGENYSLVLTTTGQLYTFGDNDFGENGYAADTNPHPTPTLVTIPGANGPIVEVAAGANSSLALTATGQVFGWGDNNFGALGNATNDNTDVANPPTQIAFPAEIGPVVQIAEGPDFGLAITSSGQLYTWGDNQRGQLGYPADSTPNPSPFQIALPGATGPPVRVAAGDSFSLVATSTGQLYVFGDNDSGEIGLPPDTNPHPTPNLLSLPGATGGVVSVAAGFNRSLAVTSSGQLYAWGFNGFGELGFDTAGNPQPTPTLVPLPAGTTIDGVSAGAFAFHSLALVADLAVASSSLPAGQVASRYSGGVRASGGTPAYTWAASGLPPGLSLNPATGTITGTPSTAGSYQPVFTVTDADGVSAGGAVAITIAPPPPPTAQRLGTSFAGSVTTFVVACAGISGQMCSGDLVATTRLRMVGNKIVGEVARVKAHSATVIVAHAGYSIAAGTTARVILTLNRMGKRLLRRFLHVPAQVTFTGSMTQTRTVTFAYPRVLASVPRGGVWSWACTPSGSCHTTVQQLAVVGLPSHATVVVSCHGGGCPFAKRTFRPHSRRLELARSFARARLQPGGSVKIVITAATRVGRVFVFTIRARSVPKSVTLCLAPGARKPQSCS